MDAAHGVRRRSERLGAKAISEIQTRRRAHYTRVARENRSTDILEKRVVRLVEVLAELVLRARSRGGPEAVRKKARERRDRRDENVISDESVVSRARKTSSREKRRRLRPFAWIAALGYVSVTQRRWVGVGGKKTSNTECDVRHLQVEPRLRRAGEASVT